MAAIATENLTKYYGDTRGIEELSLVVEEGEVFGFLGPNGAGKTTTIRTLLGFQSPTSGSAEVLGYDIGTEQELLAAKRAVGYLPSDPGLDETVTGRRLIEYFGALQGDQRSEELLELFSPPIDRKVGEYSHGNRQMLAIVIAFMHDPQLIIMDEPTTGLDPLKQERFHEFVRRERDQGKTVFLSSHILSEVQKVCDRVGIVRNGRLVELEEVGTLLGRSGKVVTVRVAEAVEAADFALEGVHDLTVGGAVDLVATPSDGDGEPTTVSFTYTGGYNELLEHLRSYTVLDLEVEEAPLEEVFLRFYGDQANGVASTDEAVVEGRP